MNFENFPNEMKTLNQWAVFRTYFDKIEQKNKKVIISPITNEFAKSDSPATWSNFETAKRYCEKNRYKGLVFALTSGITFIDIDHAVDRDTGEILNEDARQLVQRLSDTYIEKSVSGTGLHLLIKGSLPDDALKRNKKGFEMYDTKRFVCMTGDLISSLNTIKDCSDTITELNKQIIGVRPEPIALPKREIEWSPSDNELVEKIRASKNGANFEELYNGVMTGCGNDHSVADFSFCKLLAWWTQDVNQIDRIFRSSALYRPKWETHRGNTTYGLLTIERALRYQLSSYTPPKHKAVRFSDYEM